MCHVYEHVLQSALFTENCTSFLTVVTNNSQCFVVSRRLRNSNGAYTRGDRRGEGRGDDRQLVARLNMFT